jgi:CRP/FNR family cyclic AMP-dependent transcriptional regulator
MLGSRVRYLGDRLSNLATGSVMSRLIKLLISLVYDLLPDAEAWAKPVALPVRISQEQLASMTGSTQPTVSDLLQKLHKAGLIAIAHRQITICNPLHLLAHAEEIVED